MLITQLNKIPSGVRLFVGILYYIIKPQLSAMSPLGNSHGCVYANGPARI